MGMWHIWDARNDIGSPLYWTADNEKELFEKLEGAGYRFVGDVGYRYYFALRSEYKTKQIRPGRKFRFKKEAYLHAGKDKGRMFERGEEVIVKMFVIIGKDEPRYELHPGINFPQHFEPIE